MQSKLSKTSRTLIATIQKRSILDELSACPKYPYGNPALIEAEKAKEAGDIKRYDELMAVEYKKRETAIKAYECKLNQQYFDEIYDADDKLQEEIRVREDKLEKELLNEVYSIIDPKNKN